MGLERTWNINDVGFSLNGYPIEGGGENERLTIEWDSDTWEDIQGVDGETVRNATNDLRATITLTLRATSPFNDTIEGLRAADATTGLGVVAALVDLPGIGSFVSPESWIMRPANMTLGRSPGERQWPIRCAALTPVPLAGTDIENFFGSILG